MAARHRKSGGSVGRASGGGIAVASGNPNVIAEARERKKGGKVMPMDMGGKGKMRLDKPARKSGGRVGADKSPFSSAHSNSSANAAPKSNSKR